MRVSAVRWTPLLAVFAAILSGPAAFGALRGESAPPASPLPGHAPIAALTMAGKVTGDFRGGGVNGAINVVGLSFALTAPLDAHTHFPLGKSICDGVDFRKPTDGATPELFESMSRNETIARAVFRERGLTIALTDAALHSVRHVVAGTTGGYEDVTLVPSQIEFVWHATSRTAVHRCAL